GDELEGCPCCDDGADQEQAMVLHEVTRGDDKPGDGRQRLIAEHIMENGFEFRHDEDQQKTHDPNCQCDHDHGIDHCRDDLVFDLRGFLLKLRKPVKHQLEHAADLARFDHVDKQVVKNLWVKGERFRKRITALYGVSEFVNSILKY